MGESDGTLRAILVLASLSPCLEGVDPTLGEELLVGFGDGEGFGSIFRLAHGVEMEIGMKPVWQWNGPGDYLSYSSTPLTRKILAYPWREGLMGAP